MIFVALLPWPDRALTDNRKPLFLRAAFVDFGATMKAEKNQAPWSGK